MNTNNSVPNLWDAPAWTLELEKRHASHRIPGRSVKLQRPFALIGSASHCDLRIDEPHVPSVAYLVCAFPHCVEIWPTAAIAFPRWGIVQPQHEIVIGHSRVKIHHPALESALPLEPRPVDIPLEVHWNEKQRSIRLRRAVTILGRDQPSMLRLQGQSLEPCDHALVAQEDKLWLIDLVANSRSDAPRSHADRNHSQVTCLSQPRDAVDINGVKLVRGNSQTDPAIEATPLEMRRVIKRPPVALQAVFADRIEVASPPNPPRLPTAPPAPEMADPGLASEELASRVTTRLVSLKHQKGSRYRRLLTSILSRTGIHRSAAAALLAAIPLLSRWNP